MRALGKIPSQEQEQSVQSTCLCSGCCTKTCTKDQMNPYHCASKNWTALRENSCGGRRRCKAELWSHSSLDRLECIRIKWKFLNEVGLWCFVVRESHWHVSKSQFLWNPFPTKFCKQKCAKRIKAQLYLVETLTSLEVWSQISNSFYACAAKPFRYALPRLLTQQSKHLTYFHPFFHYNRETESSQCDLCLQIMKSEQRHFSAVHNSKN